MFNWFKKDEELDYENVLFVIKMDTIDYVFTDDV